MGINWNDVLVNRECGAYAGLCCLSVEDMYLLRNILIDASIADIQRFRKLICGCGTSVPTGSAPGTQNECQSGNCGCTDAVKKLCSDSGAKAKLYAYAAGLTALCVAAAPAVTTPGGLAVIAAAKDYSDALRQLSTVCMAGNMTKDDIKEFCSQHAAAKEIQKYLPGAAAILSGVDSLIGPAVSTCCSDWSKPVPVEEGFYHDDWSRNTESSSYPIGSGAWPDVTRQTQNATNGGSPAAGSIMSSDIIAARLLRG